MADTSRGDWQCVNPECYNHTNYPQAYVYGSSANCKKCGTGKNATRPGDWSCPNASCINNKNCVYASKATCPKCGCPKPGVSAGGNAGKGGGKGMNMLALPMPPPAQGFGGGGCGGARQGDWHCANPDCKNHTGNVVYGSKMSCPICGMDKPENPVLAAPGSGFQSRHQQQQQPAMLPQFGGNGGGFGGGGMHGGRPGDWHCPNASCKNHVDNVVYGSKSNCPICNTAKPSPGALTIGYRGGGGGRGGGGVPNMRPGDWHCANQNCKNHTDNIIFASKVECPLCGQQKPTGRLRSRSPYSASS